MFTVFFVGTAGSGKSTLVGRYAEFLEDMGFDVAVANMDPAAEVLPYAADMDVRQHVSARRLMRDYGLGPNAAIVASIDMAIAEAERIKEEVEAIGAPYVLVDTPGQMELFAFRHTGPLLVERLSGDRAAVVFVIDTTYAASPTGLVTSLLLSLSVRIRFSKPQIDVLNKIDLIGGEELEAVQHWLENYEELQTVLERESHARMEYGLAHSISNVILAMGGAQNIIPVSAKMGQGLDAMYRALQQIYAGGEDFQLPP